MNSLATFNTVILVALSCLLAGCPSPDSADNTDETEPANTVADSSVDSSDLSPTESEPKEPALLPDNAPVLKYTAEEILAGNKSEDRDAFRQELVGKWLEISGKVDSLVQRKHHTTPTVNIGFPFQAKNGHAWEKVSVGDEVTYRMIFTTLEGFIGGEVIAGGTPTPTITAAELAKAYETSADKVKSDMVGKFMIVTGKVLDDRAKFEKNTQILFGSGHIGLTLVGTNDTPIVVKADFLALKEAFKPIKPGEGVRVFGKIEVQENDYGEPEKRPYKIGLDGAVTVPDRVKLTTAKPQKPAKPAVYVIDVRSKDEWDTGHVESATHIPHTEIGERISAVTTDKSAKIVLYCAVGGRAGRAKTKLEELGYTNVENAGGYDDVKDRFK